MLRGLVLMGLLVLVAALPAKAQTVFSDDAMVRQFVATVELSPRQLAERLAADLPDGSVQGGDGAYMIAFADASTPVPLIRFLTSTFAPLAEDGPSLSRGLNVSLHLSEAQGGGTEVRAMLVSRASADAIEGVRAFHSRLLGMDIPQGAEILVDGASDGSGGDLVLALRGTPQTARDSYTAALEAAGYATQATPLGPATLIQAERSDALVMIFIQADPDRSGRSVVVIRSTEDA